MSDGANQESQPGRNRGGESLSIDRLTVRYPGRREPALRDVSIAVDGGEIVGVSGRTGAGKSTLTLTAAGFIPRVVRAHVDGVATVGATHLDRATPTELAGRVGIVFSTPANQLSASKLSVREELAFGLENLGVPREEMDARVDSVLARLGIGHLADREPFALSGGEQQRVAIASIVAMGTSVLVLDEPTAQLDPVGTASVASLLRELAESGTAVLCAEHAPTVLGSVDRCLVLDAGEAVALGDPGDALASRILEPRGLRPPPLVRLAELAGVTSDRAFDEEAIVEAFRKGLVPEARHVATPEDAPMARPQDVPLAAPVGERAATPVAVHAAPSTRPTEERIEAGPDMNSIRGESAKAICFRDLVHRYPGGVVALRGVSLTIEPGEAVAIVGQNGSGKTTLVKHLNGLLRPDEGSIVIGERDIADAPVSQLARSVGFVFQNPDDQLFNRSVEREVSFGPRNLGVDATATHKLVDRALRLAGLTDVAHVNPYDLGLSIRKLVALASVLAMEPAVLVLDEPTTGQDGPGVERIASIVDAYRRAGRTVVAISHDMEFAAAHFSRVVVMRDGTIIADGSPTTVFASANHELLATTGIFPPAAARIGTRLGFESTPTEAALLAALGSARGAH